MALIPQALPASRLPAELERDIFEIAAAKSPTSVPRFLLVARRFRIWFEPELYRVLRSGEGRVVPPLYNARPARRRGLPPEEPTLDLARLQRIGPWVRHILLQHRPVREIAQVLAACPYAHDVALWIPHGAGAPLVPALARLPLRRLSLDPSAFFDAYPGTGGAGGGAGAVPLDQAPFRGLTHLEIINASASWAKWRALARLPRLTHLAVAGMLDQVFVDRALRECAALGVLVLFYTGMHELEELDLVQKDPRVVLLRSVVDHLAHWEAGARGGEDFWVTAERQVGEAREAIKQGGRRYDLHTVLSALNDG